jgi:hypothetical protein
MMRFALLLGIPVWSAVAFAVVRGGGRRLAWGVTAAAALALAAWAGSRVGTANPMSRTARWDPWLVFVIGTALLAIPAVGILWGVTTGVAAGRPGWQAIGLGALAGLAAVPVALAVAVLVEMLWPH